MVPYSEQATVTALGSLGGAFFWANVISGRSNKSSKSFFMKGAVRLLLADAGVTKNAVLQYK
jgi:hypothetical protein